MTRGLYILAVVLGLILGILLLFISKPASTDSRLIVDLSWPNCGAKLANLTPSGIIGVNGGLDFRANPCLGSETQLFHNSYALYLNTGYPGTSYGLKFANYPKDCKLNNSFCIAYNYGYNDALYTLKYASNQDAHSFVWWLDVETDNSWTNDSNQNREALIGMVAAIKTTTFMPTIGFYSYPAQWQLITKNWKNNNPSWLATGSVNENIAVKSCSESFNGSQTWLSQYTSILDYNYSCLPKILDNFKIR